MLPSGARKCTHAFPLSSSTSWRISIPRALSSLAAALTLSTRNPTTGSGREVTVHLTAGSEDFHFATVRQLEYAKLWKIKVRLETEDVSKELDRLLKVVCTGTDPGELDYLHASS